MTRNEWMWRRFRRQRTTDCFFLYRRAWLRLVADNSRRFAGVRPLLTTLEPRHWSADAAAVEQSRQAVRPE